MADDTLKEHIERIKALSAVPQRLPGRDNAALASSEDSSLLSAPTRPVISIDNMLSIPASFTSPPADIVDLYSLLASEENTNKEYHAEAKPDASTLPTEEATPATSSPSNAASASLNDVAMSSEQEKALRKAKRENAQLQFQIHQLSATVRKLADEKQELESDVLKTHITSERSGGPIIYQGVRISRGGAVSPRNTSVHVDVDAPAVPPPSPPPGISRQTSGSTAKSRRTGYAERQAVMMESRVKYSPVRAMQLTGAAAPGPRQSSPDLQNERMLTDGATEDSLTPPPPPDSLGSRRFSEANDSFPITSNAVAVNLEGYSPRGREDSNTARLSSYQSQIKTLKDTVDEQAAACKTLEECLQTRDKEIRELKKAVADLEQQVQAGHVLVEQTKLECEARVATIHGKSLGERERLLSEAQQRAEHKLASLQAEHEAKIASFMKSAHDTAVSQVETQFRAAVLHALDVCANTAASENEQQALLRAQKTFLHRSAAVVDQIGVVFTEVCEGLRSAANADRDVSLARAKASYEQVLRQYEGDLQAWKRKAEWEFQNKQARLEAELDAAKAEIAVLRANRIQTTPHTHHIPVRTDAATSPKLAEDKIPSPSLNAKLFEAQASPIRPHTGDNNTFTTHKKSPVVNAQFEPRPDYATPPAASNTFARSPVAIPSARSYREATTQATAMEEPLKPASNPIFENNTTNVHRMEHHQTTSPQATTQTEDTAATTATATNTTPVKEGVMDGLEPRLHSTIFALSIATLRSMLSKAGIPHEDCLEKAELQQRLLSAVMKGKQVMSTKSGETTPPETAAVPPPSVKTTIPSPQELKNWIPARAEDGSTYYYHKVTRAVRWDRPDVEVARKVEARIQEQDEAVRKRQADRLAALAEEENKARQEAALRARLTSEIDAKVHAWARGKTLIQLLSTLPAILSRDIPAGIAIQAQSGSLEEVKKAYLKALRIVHPDKVQTSSSSTVKDELEAQRVFTILTEAYERYSSMAADDAYYVSAVLRAKQAHTSSMASAAERARAAFESMHGGSRFRTTTEVPSTSSSYHTEHMRTRGTNPYAFAASVKFDGNRAPSTAANASAAPKPAVFVR